MVEKKEVNFFGWFKTKKTTKIFAIISLILGLLFIMQSTITKRIFLDLGYSLNPFLVIGILIILCSTILGVYSLKKE